MLWGFSQMTLKCQLITLHLTNMNVLTSVICHQSRSHLAHEVEITVCGAENVQSLYCNITHCVVSLQLQMDSCAYSAYFAA